MGNTANVWSAMLQMSNDDEHSSLVLGFREKAFRFSLLDMMLVIGFSEMAFIRLRNSFHNLT